MSLIGLDLGTSGARAVAIDDNAQILATATESYPLATPRPGWTEQNPETWWAASQAVLQTVMSALPDRPAALGLTGQMHGAVFLDAQDQVIRPAILWNDQRTARQCQAITELVGAERLVAVTGNPALTGFQAPKILWLRDEEPSAYAKVRSVLLPKDYVRLRLTGLRATDASDASGSLLLDLRKRDWSDDILGQLRIPRDWLPTIHESPEVTGTVSVDAARTTGLPAGLPVTAGGGDNAAAAIGNGIIQTGILSSSIGTSGVVFAHTDDATIDPKGRLHAFCHAVPHAYHLMGVTLAAGGSLQWWREVTGAALSYDAMTAAAAQVPPGSEGLVFLPYIYGERTPHLDPLARGAFMGLSNRHSAAHLTRAVMEGVVYGLKDSLDLIASLAVPVTKIRATGGGARNQLWLQLQADVFGLPVYRSRVDEGPAFGAALLAGVAGGVFRSVAEACGNVELDSEMTAPDPARHRVYEQYLSAFADLYPAAAPVMHRLADLGSQDRGTDPNDRIG
jgi:xylulokinase